MENITPLQFFEKSTSSQDTSQKEILWLLSQFNIHYTQNPEELMLKAPQGSENQNKKDMQNVATFFPHTHPITTKISNHSTDKDFLVCKKEVQRRKYAILSLPIYSYCRSIGLFMNILVSKHYSKQHRCKRISLKANPAVHFLLWSYKHTEIH